MRKNLIGFGLFFAFAAVVILPFFNATAKNPNIVERFSIENKTDEGASGTYNFDKDHSSIGFRVKHMGLVEVPGYFRDFTGAISYDAKDVSKSTVEFTAKMTSVDTRAT